MHALLLFLHLAGAIVWIGGMAFAHFALRPAAVQLLEPPARLTLMAGTLGRFFRLVGASIVALLVSGGALLAPVGFARAPLGWHVMLAAGLVMTGVFLFIVTRPWPALRSAVAAQQWPVAARALDTIRRLVLVNLGLGSIAVAAATLARG